MKKIFYLIGFIVLLASCQKEEPFIDRAGMQYDSVPFIVKLNAERYYIQIRSWPTMLNGYDDGVVLTPAYDVVHPNTSYYIYYRDYVVYAYYDSKLEYIGWNTVQDSNFVDVEHLNPDTIDILFMKEAERNISEYINITNH